MSTHRPVKVEKNSVLIGNRNRLNLLEGPNIALTAVDDPANNEIDVTITASAGTLYQPWTYIFVYDGANYLAINGATGNVDYTSGNAYTTIQSAITATSGVYGNKDPTSYLLGPGTWTINQSIVLPEECTFAGCGPDSTRLVASGAIGPVITSRNATYTWGVQIRDMRIDGDNTATYGIYWNHSTCTLPVGHTYYCWLSLFNLNIRGCTVNPIYQKRTLGDSTISYYDNLRVTGVIYLEGVSDSKFNQIFCGGLDVKAMASCHFTTWYIGGALTKNLNIHGGSAAYPCEKLIFVDVRSDNAIQSCLYIEDYAEKITFSGCMFTNRNDGIMHADAANNNKYAAVHLQGSSNLITFAGCVFCQDTTPKTNTGTFKYWYEESGAANYNMITGCVFDSNGIGTAPLGAHGANTEHPSNIGD